MNKTKDDYLVAVLQGKAQGYDVRRPFTVPLPARQLTFEEWVAREEKREELPNELRRKLFKGAA
jgi:hypothetical protein